MITPALVLSMSTGGESGTIKHQLLDGSSAFTLRPAAPTEGQLHLFFTDRAAAWAAYTAHRLPAVWTYEDDENPERSLQYVVVGRSEPELDSDTRNHWHLLIDYSAVS